VKPQRNRNAADEGGIILADQEHGSRSSHSMKEAGPASSSSSHEMRNKYLGKRALRTEVARNDGGGGPFDRGLQRDFAATAGGFLRRPRQLRLAEQNAAWSHPRETWGLDMDRRASCAVAIGMTLPATALGGASALAADLPLKAPPKPTDFNPFW